MVAAGGRDDAVRDLPSRRAEQTVHSAARLEGSGHLQALDLQGNGAGEGQRLLRCRQRHRRRAADMGGNAFPGRFDFLDADHAVSPS
jgi:hypothetical protein